MSPMRLSSEKALPPLMLIYMLYNLDYFRHADCIKEKSMNPEHCGDFYTRMIEMMRGNNAALQRELCW